MANALTGAQGFGGGAVAVADWYADVPRSAAPATIWGVSILVCGLIGFGGWAYTAPIAGAVVATGAFVTTGQNKIVQHLEGGVISKIMAREGDLVNEGDTLMVLDDTAAKVDLRRLLLKEVRLAAIEARLQAEVNDWPTLIFPPEIVQQARSDAEMEELLRTQAITFVARRENTASQIAVLKESVSALQQHIDGTVLQVAAVNEQIGLLNEEHEGKQQLLKQGLIRKPDVLAVRRARSNLQGELGRLTGDIGDFKDRIARTKEQIISTQKAAIKTAVEQLQETRGDLVDVRERIRTARQVLARTTIQAPVRGTVVKLRYNTSGGVIEPGKSVLEIVPHEAELLIEVQIRPQDIENVKVGQDASVRLTALNRRVTPTIAGHVVYLSADALPNEKRNVVAPDAYVARLRVDVREAAKLHGFRATAGMPAEVYIKTADRSFLEYLLKPLKDSMSRAFREF